MPQTATGLYVPRGGAPSEGYQASLALANPPSATNLSYTVGASFYEELLNAKAVFDTSASLGARSVTLTIEDANGVIQAIMPSAGSQTATLTYYYNFTPSLVSPVKDTVAQVIGGPVPPMILQPNWHVVFLVSNMQPGDQFSGGLVTVNRIPTGVELPPPLELVATPVTL